MKKRKIQCNHVSNHGDTNILTREEKSWYFISIYIIKDVTINLQCDIR